MIDTLHGNHIAHAEDLGGHITSSSPFDETPRELHLMSRWRFRQQSCVQDLESV